MIEMLKELRATIAAATVAVAMIVTAALTNFDLVNLNLRFLEGLAKHDKDDVLTGLMLIFAGLAVDRVLSYRKRRHQAQIEAQKLRTLQATMRTVQDIVNNFLNNMQLVELEAGDALSPETVELLETIKRETADKLKALGDLASPQETEMASGMGIDYSSPLHLDQTTAVS
jgi:hypothetical protein